MIPVVREDTVIHLEMLSKSFDGYFAAGDANLYRMVHDTIFIQFG